MYFFSLLANSKGKRCVHASALANLGQEVHLPQHFAEHGVNVVHLRSITLLLLLLLLSIHHVINTGYEKAKLKQNKASMYES